MKEKYFYMMNIFLIADNKRNDVPRGGLNNTENWDEEENCSTPANPRPPHVSARPKFGIIYYYNSYRFILSF